MNSIWKSLSLGRCVFRHKIRYASRIGQRARPFSSNTNEAHNRPLILGIETSCDDTGCAIVDGKGNILGESVHSQHLVHVRNGGIIPPVAQELHRKYIEPVVDETFKAAGLTGDDIDAIALTVKPGLPLSLMVGFKYAKFLARQFSKPIIPIHHMEAHALMARLENPVQFPFLVLLVSGGHCLLALVNDVDDFKLMGESSDDAPGEAFDKIARRLKLRNFEGFSGYCGGQAIEVAAARATDPLAFEFPLIMAQIKDCNFSFAGIKNKILKHLLRMEKHHNVIADGTVPEVYALCAGYQLAITRHICHRTKRAMQYLNMHELLPENNRTLVVSGGVASNNFIYQSLAITCEEEEYNIVRPRPKLCTDNGVMIAWNGVERWKRNIGIVNDIDSIDITSKCALGESIIEDIAKANISCKPTSLKSMLNINSKLKLTI